MNAVVGSKSKGDVIQVTWDNVDELDAYIAKLKKAADQLSIENRQLRRCHFNISDKVRSPHFKDAGVSVVTSSLFYLQFAGCTFILISLYIAHKLR